MLSHLNPLAVKIPFEKIFCYSHTFLNNLVIKRKFTKYLKESCCLASDYHFSFKYFPKDAYVRKIYALIVRPVLAALIVNGLTQRDTIQIFNSSTSQLDNCQCLVVQTPMDNMSKAKPSSLMSHLAC